MGNVFRLQVDTERGFMQSSRGESTLHSEACSGCTIAAHLQEAQKLGNICGFFALALRYPENGQREELQRIIEELSTLFAEFGVPVPQVPQEKELQAEYVRLFVNNFQYVPGVPYASYHLDGAGELQGPSYQEILRLMSSSGLTMRSDLKEQEDHMALLFEFCFRMLQRFCTTGRGEETEMQSLAFLLQKALPVVLDSVAEPVGSNARFGFYPRIVELAQAILRDAGSIEDVLSAAAQRGKT